MAKANSKFHIFRDPTFWDDNFVEDWSVYRGTLETDGDIGTFTIGTLPSVYADKSVTFYADVDEYIIVKIDTFEGDFASIYARQASDSAWKGMVEGNITSTGIHTFTPNTEQKCDAIRISMDGAIGEKLKLDYIVICHRTYLEIQPQIKGQPSCEIVQRLLSSGVSAVHGFQIDNSDGTYTDAIRPNDVLLAYLWREGDSEKKVFGGRIVEPGGSGDASTNTFLTEFEAYGHEQALQSGEQLVQESYSNTNGRTIITDALGYCPQITDEFVDEDEDIASTHTFDKDEIQPFDVINDVCRQAKTLGGVVGFDAYVDPAGNCHVFKRGKNISILTPSTMTLYSYKISRDTLRVRNAIPIYGKMEKNYPSTRDSLTEQDTSETPADDGWSGGTLSWGSTNPVVGDEYLESTVGGVTSLDVGNSLPDVTSLDCEGWTRQSLSFLHFYIRIDDNPNAAGDLSIYVQFYAPDASNWFGYYINWKDVKEDMPVDDNWYEFRIPLGPNADGWFEGAGSPDWMDIREVHFMASGISVGTITLCIDDFYFGGRYYYGFVEDVVSQDKYGTKYRTPEIDESLTSDNECEARAQGLLEFLAYPIIKLSLVCEGDNDLQVGDKLRVTLTKEDVDDWFRIIEVKHKLYGTRWDTHLTLSNETEYVDYVFAMTGQPKRKGASLKVAPSEDRDDVDYLNIQEAIDVLPS